MSIYQRADGRGWIIDVKVDGQRIRKTLPKGTQRRELAAVERRLRGQLENGRKISLRSPTWETMAADYWQAVAQHQASKRNFKYHVNALSDAIGDATKVHTISTATFADLVTRWRGKLGASTINQRLTYARRIWNWNVEIKELNLPRISWNKLRLPEADPAPVVVPHDARRAILSGCIEPHIRHAITIAEATGLRPSSVVRMRWENVHWDLGHLITTGKSQKPGGKSLILPITPELQDILNEIGVKKGGPVISYRGRAVKSIRRGFEGARARAGYPNTLLKSYRSTVGTELLPSRATWTSCPMSWVTPTAPSLRNTMPGSPWMPNGPPSSPDLGHKLGHKNSDLL